MQKWQEVFRGPWDDYVAKFEFATAYHERWWADVIKASCGFEECSLLGFEDGVVEGILPLWKVNAKTIVSCPWRDQAPGLFDNDGIARQFFKKVGGWDEDIFIRGHRGSVNTEHFRIDSNYWNTSKIDLSIGFEGWWKSVNKYCGRNVRKALREGVAVEIDSTITGVTHFYELFSRFRRALGVPIYPRRFFENIVRIGKEKVRLYKAVYEGRVISSILVLDGINTSTYAFGASDKRFFALRPNDLLIFKAVEDSFAKHKLFFDFGSDSPCQVSLFQFKAKWGSEVCRVPLLYKTKQHYQAKDHDFAGPNFRFHRSVLRLMPENVLRAIGLYMFQRHG